MNEYTYNNLYEIEERKQLIASSMILLRTKYGKTQKEVAETIGIKPNTYNQYEKMKNEPPAEIIVRLAQYYGVSADDILQTNNMWKDKSVREKAIGEITKELSDLTKQLENADKTEEEKRQAIEMLKKTEELKDLINNISSIAFDE
ncbi:MAG: helix-turn-helix domain-containing protein [Oscillospiraceae bacterium]|nr:helix-turn-helix domain-containing protein [Oscillospiraceae bacterium]